MQKIINEILANENFNAFSTSKNCFLIPLRKHEFFLNQQQLIYQNNATNTFCLIYIKKNKGTLFLDDKNITLSEGNLGLFPFSNNSSWKFEPADNICHFTLLLIYGEAVKDFFNFCEESVCAVTSSLPSYKLDSFFETLKPNPVHIDDLLSNSLSLNEILTKITLVSHRTCPSCNNAIPNYILETKKMFDIKFENKYTLEELANQFHVSKYRFVHEFTRHIGNSPINYLNKKRIEAAKSLLISTSEKVKTIGTKVGIENTNHFIHLFKKETNFTPLEYRKKYEKNL